MTSRPVGQEGHCFLVVYYVANLLNICAELFFPEKSESFARFFSHKCSMQVNVKEFLRNLNVFYSTSLLHS